MAKTRKSKLLKEWLQLHASGEKRLKTALRKFFAGQRSRMMAAAKELPVLTVDSAASLLDVDVEYNALMERVSPVLAFLLGAGALRVFMQRPAKLAKKSKAFEFDWDDLSQFRLPDSMKTSMQNTFDDLANQSFWRDIQSGSLLSITDSLQRGIEDGLSIPNLRKLLESEHKTMSAVRAELIARTETNAAMGRGAQTSYEALKADGDELQKAWISVVDADTRADHAAADNQTVDVEDEFTVGSEKCMHPGDPSLSAAQRCNCRCGTVGVWSD